MSYLSPQDFIEAISSTQGDVLIVDNSALNVFNTCPRKFFYGYKANIQKRGADKDIARGIAMHDALYHYYLHNDDAEKKACAALMKSCRDQELDLKITKNNKFSAAWGIYILQKYFVHRSKQTDIFETLCDKDGVPYLECGFALDLGAGIFTGKIDRIVKHRQTGKIYLEDHKTTNRSLNSYFWEGFSPNNQITGYWYAAQELLGLEISGFIINALRTKTFDRIKESELADRIFVRQIYNRSPAQIEARIHQIQHQMNIIRYMLSTGDMNSFWMNAPDGCTAYHRRCPYELLCNADDSVAQILLPSNFDRREWEPYEELKQAKIVLAKEKRLA